MPQEHSAGAVVYRLERGKPVYLLLHYEAKHWDLPKGNIEEGESVEETARREIREETGIKDVEFVPGFETKIEYVFCRETETFEDSRGWKPKGALARESEIPLFKPPIKYTVKTERETVHKDVIFLLAKTGEKKVKLSFEHIGFEWLPFEKAVKKLTYENAKELLRNADSFLNSSK